MIDTEVTPIILLANSGQADDICDTGEFRRVPSPVSSKYLLKPFRLKSSNIRMT